jgi:hypothetical protein
VYDASDERMADDASVLSWVDEPASRGLAPGKSGQHSDLYTDVREHHLAATVLQPHDARMMNSTGNIILVPARF